jgi:predicted TIM-barrel fold metal-dependent hydrolase
LPHVLEAIGNRFVLGSDMPHTETVDKRSKQLVLLERTDLSEADKRKILEANPKAFFRVPAWERMKPRALAALKAPAPD